MIEHWLGREKGPLGRTFVFERTDNRHTGHRLVHNMTGALRAIREDNFRRSDAALIPWGTIAEKYTLHLISVALPRQAPAAPTDDTFDLLMALEDTLTD
jgi:hypothetical protein